MSFFGDDFVAPSFADVELGDGQRWSTWPASIPTNKGPKPWPDWVVTSAGAVDTELGIVKSGKEAELFLLERAVPGDPTQTSILAAKRYRGADNSDFRRSAVYRSADYTDGRRTTRNTRDLRAMARGTTYGRSVAAGQWAAAEFGALCTAYAAGLPVPYPVQLSHTEVLMEFIGDDRVAAPRLAAAPGGYAEHCDRFEQVVEIMRGFARLGFAHGDLSAYNLLVHRGRVVVIDLPQIVDLIGNPNGFELLERDVRNVCGWFDRQRVPNDPDAVFGELVAEALG